MKTANGHQTAVHSLHILLVEDCLDLLTSLARYLNSLGHHILAARNLQEARAFMKRECFDLLLVDLDLPDGDGCELLSELPIGCFGVSCSGFTDPSPKVADPWLAHLRKPYNEHDLDAVLGLVQQRRFHTLS